MRSIRARRSGALGLAALSTVAALATAALGCSSELPAPIPTAHPDSTTPRRGGTITSASFGDIRTVDPANVGDGLVAQVLESIFAGLLDYDVDGKLQPDLAERWTTSEDGKTIRFVLREGAHFHDGEEVTADDVKRSVERALHPSAPNPYSAYFASIAGYADFVAQKTEHLDGVTVEGRYVVSFHLESPDAAFLPLLAMPPLRPVCKSAGTRYVDTWHPCGAGPFKLLPGGWDRGREITVVRHEGYYQPGLPYVDSLHLLFHASFNVQRFKFERGDIDILRDFLAPDLAKFQADPRWKPFGEYEVDKQIGGISMNTEMAPFDNIEIRRAVASALDRDQIRLIKAANMRAADRPVPPGVEGYDPNLRGQTYDYAAALEHMKRAGYPYDPITKTGGWPHVVSYLTYAQSIDEFMSQVVQQQLARIGLRIDIRIVNYPALIALRGRRRETAMGPGFWMQDYPEAGSFLEPLFTSKGINDGDANNWSFYKNRRVDELVERAKHEVARETRLKDYSEAQQIICDEAPWAFTHFYRFYVQWHPYLRNHHPHPIASLDARSVWIDRATGPVAARAIFSGNAMAKLFGDAR